MDIQLLMRIGRMTPPRWLVLSADVAAAKRLMASGMIEATLETQCGPRAFVREAVLVHAVTHEGALAIASEKSCSWKKTVLPTP
jgi:hypothetical protein